jgi:predicted DNA-binding transcriptional regulator AlpA
MEMTMEPELMTVEEVAKLCRTPLSTVRNRWVYRPDFPRAYKPGKRCYWARREVLQWLENQRVSA